MKSLPVESDAELNFPGRPRAGYPAERGPAGRRPDATRVDVQKLRVIEGVDHIRPELKAPCPEIDDLRDRHMPLTTSRQPERRHRCVAVLTGRRWDERLRIDPLEATAFAGCRIADLIGAQGGVARIVVIAVHGANPR